VLQPFSFTYNIYNALLEILLDNISVESLDNAATASLAQSPSAKKPLVLRNLAILQIIFELLSRSDVELKVRIHRHSRPGYVVAPKVSHASPRRRRR
jgi:hypothetical protein